VTLKPLCWIPVLLVAGLFPVGSLRAQGARTTSATSNSEAIRVSTTLQALFTASERSDMLALDSLYAGDSLTIFEGTGVNRGWTDYREHHLGPELKEMKNLQYRPSDLDVHVVGNSAWVLFRYTLKADVNGRAADVVGLGTAILERRGASWVVRHMHTSGRARRPIDPA